MEVIYIDVLTALNLLVDFLLLAATARLSGVYARRLRLLGGAAAGAAYAALAVLPVPWILTCLPARLAAGFGMVALAFGRNAPLGKLYAWFLAASCGFAGFATALYLLTGTPLGTGGVYYFDVPLRVVLGACALAYVATGLLFRGAAKHGGVHRTTEEVTLTAFGRTARFTLLLDSGCDLTDPVSGRPVLVLERQAAARLLPPGLRFLCASLGGCPAADVLERIPAEHRAAFRLLPYRTVGTAGGLLLMFHPTSAVRGGRAFETYVAISPQRIADGRYEGLIGV